MEVVNTTQKALVLDSTEVEKMKLSFEYLKHRIAYHKASCGVISLGENSIDVRFCDYVLTMLEQWKK